MLYHPGGIVNTGKGLIFVGFLLLLQKTYSFRRNHPSSDDDSFSLVNANKNYFFSKYKIHDENYPGFRSNDDDYKDETDEKKIKDDVISNHDFYKPLKVQGKERKYYVQGDQVSKEDEHEIEDISPYAKFQKGRNKWLRSHSDNTESLDNDNYEDKGDEDIEEPRYGFQSDKSHTSNSKNSGNDASWADGKHSDHKEFVNQKISHNAWDQPNQKSPFEFHSERDENKNGNGQIHRDKHLDYRSYDTYPIEDEHLKPKVWNTNDDLNENSKNPDYKTEGLPRNVNNHKDIYSKEWYEPENEDKHSSYEHHDKNWGNRDYISNDNHYGKPEFVKNDGKGNNQDYSHLPKKRLGKEKASQGIGKPIHNSFEGENNFRNSDNLKSELFKIQPYSMWQYNHGGSSYGWTYKPMKDLERKYEADLNRKIHFLQEHEKKLAEIQKKHRETMKSFMDKALHGSKRERPNDRVLAVDMMNDKLSLQVSPKAHFNKEPLKYGGPRDTYYHGVP